MRTLFIDPGAFRSEIALQRCLAVPDGMGGHDEDWQEVATVFAKIEPVSVRSNMDAGQALEIVTHRIFLRWREGVESGMRFSRGSRVFVIVTVHDPDETGRYLVCRTREDAA
ncbi:phage head closure protein [Mesorhizobium sp. SB112]|uniref:phage head closure protein n=1 Tax=Mesorhizobium sp. SB112 TaxID=3151853 RepID=UPI003267671C